MLQRNENKLAVDANNLMGIFCSLQMLPYWAALRGSKHIKSNSLNVLKLYSLKLVSCVLFLYYPSADQESNFSCPLGV